MVSENRFAEVLDCSINRLKTTRKRYQDACAVGSVSEDLLALLTDCVLSVALDLQLVILSEEEDLGD